MTALALPNIYRPNSLPDPYLVSVALLLAFVLPNPVGYVGGGGDDYYYVEAARCVAAHGRCVPDTHWAARWPLVGPMGAVFALLGDGRWQAAVVPFAYGLTTVVLFVRLLDGVWDRATALVGGVALVSTASFARELLHQSIDTVELAWMVAAAWAGHRAVKDANKPVFAVLAGTFLGLAILVRMTSVAWLPILGLAFLVVPGGYRRLAIPAIIGVAIPIAFDMLMNWRIAHDPLLTQHLSMAHTQLLSSELPAWVDRSRSPLFNPDYIGGWTPAIGIHAHWTVQGLINLLLNPAIGPVLCASLIMLVLRRKHLGWRSPEVLLAGVAALYTGTLIYALAIDPKARMFLPVAAIAAALIGRCGALLWQSGEKILAGAMLAGLVLVGTIDTCMRVDMTRPIPVISQWAREHPGDISVDETTRRFMTFDPAVRGLPVWQRAHPA